VINVDLEGGQAQLNNFDIIATVGAPATAYIASFLNLNIADGSLTIAFEGVIENPKISGIEIFDLGENPPVLDPIGDQVLTEGTLLDIPVSATDDMDIPVITGLDIPTFATLTDNGDGSGMLSIAPGFTDAGTYSLTVIATDGDGLTDSEDIIVTVNEANGVPVIDPIADQSVSEGEELDIPVTSSDPDNDAVILEVVNLTSFMSFVDNGDGTGQLTITPGFTDQGIYNVSLTATDSQGEQTQEDFQVTVTDVNAAPILAEIPDQTLEEATSVTVTLSATDPDGEVPAIEVINLQNFMSFTDNGDGTGVIDISPYYNEFGVFVIIVQAVDEAGLTDEQQVQIVVTEITGDPEWSVTGEVENANCLDQDGAITLNVSGGFGEKEYSWSNGATTKDVSGLQSGVYSVTITDRKGNQTSGSYTVNTQPGPQKPFVSQDGNFLVSTPAESYQWSFNGEELEGATDQSVEVTLFGEYSVTVADELGCTIASDPIQVNFGISKLTAYPIPTNSDLNLELILDEPEVITFIVLNSMGQQTPMGVYDLAAGRHQLTLNFNESYSDGVYMLLNNSKRLESKITRFVILR
jgi:hypothetical protein